MISVDDHWSRYWRQGHLTSLPCGFTSNYDGEFLDFWQSQFAALGVGQVVLDICSGNGSIALLARDFAVRNKLALTVKALDAANIDIAPVIAAHPHYAEHVRAIEFIPNTPLEQMDLPAASVDLVTSQFGVEYTDWATAAGVVSDVLKPGGRFSVLCHTPESRILREMERQCADYDRLFELEVFDGGLVADIHQVSPRTVRRRLNRGLDSIYDLFRQDRGSAVLGGIGQTLERIHKQAVDHFDQAMRDYVQLKEQVALSRGIARDLLAVHHALRANEAWHNAFVDAGLERRAVGEIRYRTGDIAGRAYSFTKPA